MVWPETTAVSFVPVFQPSISMISSAAVSAGDLLSEANTRKECIVTWSYSAVAREMNVKRGRDSSGSRCCRSPCPD